MVKGDKDNFYHEIMDKTEITEHSGKVEITEFSCYIVCQDKTHDEQICKHFFPFEIYFLRPKEDALQCPHKEVLICFFPELLIFVLIEIQYNFFLLPNGMHPICLL